MNTPADTTPKTADNIAAGLPDDFTLDELNAHLTEEEVQVLMEGDDPIIANTKVADADPEAAAAASAPADPEPAPADDPKPVQAPDTSAVEARVQAIDNEIQALADKYDDGELTRAEWMEQQRALIREQAAAQAQIETAMQAVNQSVADYRQTWFTRVSDYQAQHAYLADDEHFASWDAALKSVTGDANYRQLPMQKQIELAHGLYATHYEAMNGKPLPSRPGTAAQKTGQQGEPRTDPRPEPPITLAGYTQTDVNSVDDGKFAAIDRTMATDPLKAEAMINALGEEERAAYLRA